MPIMSPFRPRSNGYEPQVRSSDRKSYAVNTLTMRATQKAVDTTMRRARVDKLVTDESKGGVAPPVNVGWGSLDPSIPKKVSISRRTLHQRATNSDVNSRELDDIDQMPDGLDEEDEEESDFDDAESQTQIHEMEGSPADWYLAPAPKKRTRPSRPRYDRRRSSSAPPNKYRNASPPTMSPSRRSESPRRRWSRDDPRDEDCKYDGRRASPPHELMSPTPPVPPKSKHTKHTKSLSVPVSKHNPSTLPIQRKHKTSAARKASRTEQESIDIRSSAASVETVYIALDQQSLNSSPTMLQAPIEPEPEPEMSRAERHQANKQLYYKMKAENHNLWVLLDASNRRADLMMQNLTAEELRCKDLETKTFELQATLDTLNARRLWLQQEDDDQSSTESSPRTSSITQSPTTSTAEIEQVTAELESLRRNLDQSRNTVRKMKSFTQDARDLQRQALPAATKLQASERELAKDLHKSMPVDMKKSASTVSTAESTLFTAHELDARLRDLIKPTPVRPAKSSTNTSATPTSASRTPTRSPATEHDASDTRATPPRSEPRQFHELDATETETPVTEPRRIMSMKESTQVTQVELVSTTPDLSPPNSRPSSGADSTSSTAPSPPPKSTRRLTTRTTSQSNIHPALRLDNQVSTVKDAVPLVMAPLVEGEDVHAME